MGRNILVELYHAVRNVLELLYILVTIKIHDRLHRSKQWSYADYFESRVDKHPDVLQLITVEDGRTIKLADIERSANQIAHWAKQIGLQQKDTAALMMMNRPEYISFWVGMGKAGVSTAFLNTNITGKSFLHSVHVAVDHSTTKILVLDDELQQALANDIPELEKAGITVWLWSKVENELIKLPISRPPRSFRSEIRESDPFIYIYTSGTTGLPKASKISSTRFYVAGLPTAVMTYLKPGVSFYCCLPLYHSSGGMMCVGAAIISGATMVLRKKFSVRNFTSDCLKYNCSSMQYIGELCRYLVNAPPNPNDANLKLQYAMGNGMRPDVWMKFMERYNVGRIVEFYGATEGNVGLFNSSGKPFSLGFVPRILDFIYPVKLVKVDPENNEIPYRDENGLCVVAKPNEPGLLIGLIDPKKIDRRFDGYSDASANQKKVLHDVMKKGDKYFNSGDLLSRDEWGYFFWCDRVGDTFRWKGENVATTEVAHVLSDVPDISDVTVYGVAVPGCDGRVGMASIVLHENRTVDKFDWASFQKEVAANLPVYARPAFLRFRKQMALTSTFKHQKGDLVKDGFDPANMKDDVLFYYSAKDGKHERMTAALYEKICSGEVQL